MKVLSVNPIEKRLKLTIKPTFLQEQADSERLLTDFTNAVSGNAYFGYVAAKVQQGFIVAFFNEIRGMLSFNDIENVHK